CAPSIIDDSRWCTGSDPRGDGQAFGEVTQMEIDELVRAVQTLNAEDAFRARLTLEHWRVIAPYLARYEIRAGDLLIKQGDADRSMYFISQGSMQVFVTGGPPGSN